MLAGPTTPIYTMRRAIGRTLGALTAASKVDLDRTVEDRAFFGAQKATLVSVAENLATHHNALIAHDLGVGEELQASIELGDEVLDRGVRSANTRTKLGIKGKSGLDTSHAFGKRINELVDLPVRIQPQKVLAAVERMNDLPAFDEKTSIQADLTARAEQQEILLEARNEGDAARVKLVSACVKAVLDAANALIEVQAELNKRFPRQRAYVASFFFDVATSKKSASMDEGDDTSQSENSTQDSTEGKAIQ